MTDTWSSYRFDDFLMFSRETLEDLFALHNAALWPWQIVFGSAGFVTLAWVLSARWERVTARKAGKTHSIGGRVVALIIAAAWVGVGFFFHLRQLATIVWAASWFAALCVFEGVLFALLGYVGEGFKPDKTNPRRFACGAAILAYATILHAPTLWISGTPFERLQLFGWGPTPLALGTLGFLLAIEPRRRYLVLAVVPVLWCALAALVLRTLE